MLNMTEVQIEAFVRRLQEGYHRTYGGLRTEYGTILAWAGSMALENIANSDALYHDVEHTILVTLVGQEILRGKHIREGRSFVDEQRLGPYRFWYHYHEIRPAEDGVLLIDRVFYQPPFGILGRLLHRLYIRKTLERIFSYRRERLDFYLSGPSPTH